jgi:hypothetical protein
MGGERSCLISLDITGGVVTGMDERFCAKAIVANHARRKLREEQANAKRFKTILHKGY